MVSEKKYILDFVNIQEPIFWGPKTAQGDVGFKVVKMVELGGPGGSQYKGYRLFYDTKMKIHKKEEKHLLSHP